MPQIAVTTSARRYLTPTCSKGMMRGKKKIEKIIARPMMLCNASSLCFFPISFDVINSNTRPVSYTHLDVYKRQL